MDRPPRVAAPSHATGEDTAARRGMLLLLLCGLPLLLAQAFVPFDEFVHRGDDAFYYFQLAVDYPRLGFWSFDGVEPTNGVQPLWAMLLTALAQGAAWLGVRDPHVLARLFVAFAAVVQFAAAMLLYRLLAARVSVGTAFAAAGACIFPMGFVWGRLWGMESPLLALVLTAVASFYLAFRERPSARAAVLLGVLLGLACLSRLNAGLLIPCLLIHHLLSRDAGPFGRRLHHVVIAGAAATAVIAPYLLWNVAQTGHLLPISGQVKAIGVERALAEWDASGGPVRRYASYVYWNWKGIVEGFVGSHLLDGMWVTGVRLRYDEAPSWAGTGAAVLALLVAPAMLGRPREWLRLLGTRLRLLAPLSWFAVYAGLDAVVAVAVYPTQTYAIPQWWLVSMELTLIVLGATVAVAALGHVGARLAPARRRAALATVGAALLVVAHGWQSVAFYWDGRVEHRDWNPSWNEESYRAAQWIDANVPEGALVGAWNAGIVGYYTRHRVVNLDGLINNAALLPYLRERRIEDYILDRGVRYLSDMDGMFSRELDGRLALTEVYRHHSPFMDSYYRVYRVDGPADASGTGAGR